MAISERNHMRLDQARAAKGDHQFAGKPAGARKGGYARARTQIGFDEATRDKIAKWAAYHNRSFTAEVRVLVLEGLRQRTR